MKKLPKILKRMQKNNQVLKKKRRNDTIANSKKGIVLQVESLSYMQKKNEFSTEIIKLKNTIKSKITVITLVNIEKLLIMFVT